MDKSYPSIFNDVIGPVMRGPSSSHTAGSWRIGEILRQSVPKGIKKVIFDFDINGSLAETYQSQGSDIGLASGLLGIDMKDEKVIKSLDLVEKSGIEIEFNILDYGASHPNNYRITLYDKDNNMHIWEAISSGGGMIEFKKFDNFDISIKGDYFELLMTFDLKEKEGWVKEKIQNIITDYDYFIATSRNGKTLINIKTLKKVEEDIIKELKSFDNLKDLITLEPILPTKSNKINKVPFVSGKEILEYAKDKDLSLWELALIYESQRGNTSKDKVYGKMEELVDIMENAIKIGLKGTFYEDRILGPQGYKIEEGIKDNTLIPSNILNNVIKYITAIMEVKSSMGLIVAAPTAGSCGCLPGTIIGIGHSLNFSKEKIIKGMLAAGMVGVFIAERATFAAEVAGCQVECGAGSGMAAAGLVQMMEGSLEESIDAASLALQNITGLACDPVGGRVEVPCLGKNVMGGSNAIVSANMILAGFDKVIPLDETIDAIYDIGLKLPSELRCTHGGLGKTDTAFKIKKKLKNHQDTQK